MLKKASNTSEESVQTEIIPTLLFMDVINNKFLAHWGKKFLCKAVSASMNLSLQHLYFYRTLSLQFTHYFGNPRAPSRHYSFRLENPEDDADGNPPIPYCMTKISPSKESFPFPALRYNFGFPASSLPTL